MTLALYGGKPALSSALQNFNTIGPAEIAAVSAMMKNGPLSGFLGGRKRGGVYVQRLEELWAQQFGVRHAIACNSATSGLLAACAAAGIRPHDFVLTTPYTMSATSAAPRFFNAILEYGDIDPDTYCLERNPLTGTKAIIVTNLFGHPAKLREWKDKAGYVKAVLIEDNAQAPFAMEGDKYAGTVGDIGVFSLNIHKHIQCGEGGIICTNNDTYAGHLRGFINHGEMAGSIIPGLNLRMTEYAAAIAITQLNRAPGIITGRIRQAEDLTEVAKRFSWLKPPVVRDGCKHVYYCWAAQIDTAELGITRNRFLDAIAAEGFPMVGGYVEPLYNLPAFSRYKRPCPVAEDMHYNKLVYFENCGYNVTPDQAQEFGDALKKIESNVNQLRSAA